MGSKVLYPILFVVFACCATATAVGHSGGQHDNSGAKVSQQNCPSYTYEVDHQVSTIININIINYKIFWSVQSLQFPKLSFFFSSIALFSLSD